MRRNAGIKILGADVVKDVGKPVLWGSGGYMGAMLASSGAARIPFLANLGDVWARLIGNAAAIGLTFWASKRVKMLRDNRGAIITGMGINAVQNIVARYGAGGGPLSLLSGGMGAYVREPVLMGAYVREPLLGAYVREPVLMGGGDGMGEYVTQPVLDAQMLNGYMEGVDPADMNSIERTMDVAEAAAGVGGMGQGDEVFQAAAGMGQGVDVYEAAAGAAGLGNGTQAHYRQLPMISTLDPVSQAIPITQEMPATQPIPESIATPEGKGYAGGLFARHLFSAMMGG